MKRALIVVGKAPEAGVTKTRLSPPLTLDQAADLYRAFLWDTVATAQSLGWERVTLIYPPRPRAEQELAVLFPAGVYLQPQPGIGLGAALAGAFASHCAEGFERVVLIGSDNPTLPRCIIAAADEALAEFDLTIGPSTDGGYYLIGMSRPHLGVFKRIAWSTDVVYAETLERASELGLTVHTTPEWYDVDTIAELRRLRADLATTPPEVAPATRALLSGMELA